MMLRLARGAAAVLVAATFCFEWSVDSAEPDFVPSNFLVTFTFLSNVFLAVVLAVGAIAPRFAVGAHRAGWAYTRGLAVFCICMTGLIYNTLLLDYELTARSGASMVTHILMPIIGVLDWILVPARPRIGFGRSLTWLAAPLAYLAFSLIRGVFVDWYPYGFVDPTIGGYGRVAIWSLALTVLLAGLAIGVAALGRLRRRGVEG